MVLARNSYIGSLEENACSSALGRNSTLEVLHISNCGILLHYEAIIIA